MSSPLEQFDFSGLSVPERLDLIERIYDSIEAEAPPPALSDNLRAELDRRLNDYLAAPDNVIPWDEVKARYEKRG
jgi:putative addiction module component (TIGR02574 family)